MPEQPDWGKDAGDSDDGSSSAPPPDPEDRLWRHPSEVAAEQRLVQAGAVTRLAEGRRRRLSSSVAVATVSAVGGGLIIAGAWLAMGSRTTPFSEATSQPVPTAAAPLAAQVRISSDHGESVGAGAIYSNKADTDIVAVLDQDLAGQVIVTLANDTTHIGEIVGTDELTGVTAIRLEHPLPVGSVAATADMNEPRAGTIQSLSRTVTTSPRAGGWSQVVVEIEQGDTYLGQFIVEDAVPLGLVTSQDGEFSQLAPIDVLNRVADQLLASGDPAHPWIGIEGQATASKPPVAVTNIDAAGPAARLIEVDDRIRAVNGNRVANMADVLAIVRTLSPGSSISVDLVRDGKPLRVKLRLGTIEPR